LLTHALKSGQSDELEQPDATGSVIGGGAEIWVLVQQACNSEFHAVAHTNREPKVTYEECIGSPDSLLNQKGKNIVPDGRWQSRQP
jgi:hypothetical protein